MGLGDILLGGVLVIGGIAIFAHIVGNTAKSFMEVTDCMRGTCSVCVQDQRTTGELSQRCVVCLQQNCPGQFGKQLGEIAAMKKSSFAITIA